MKERQRSGRGGKSVMADSCSLKMFAEELSHKRTHARTRALAAEENHRARAICGLPCCSRAACSQQVLRLIKDRRASLVCCCCLQHWLEARRLCARCSCRGNFQTQPRRSLARGFAGCAGSAAPAKFPRFYSTVRAVVLVKSRDPRALQVAKRKRRFHF